MEQRGFAEAFLPPGFGRNARLERIAALIDWSPVIAGSSDVASTSISPPSPTISAAPPGETRRRNTQQPRRTPNRHNRQAPKPTTQTR